MTDRPRSDKDIVPEFSDGEDALSWMEGKLDGSWTDQTEEKTEALTAEERERLLSGPTMSTDDFNKLMGF